MEQIISAVSTVGFPIVMSVILLWQNNELRKEMLQMSRDHKAETDNLANVISENTATLRELKERLCGDVQ